MNRAIILIFFFCFFKSNLFGQIQYTDSAQSESLIILVEKKIDSVFYVKDLIVSAKEIQHLDILNDLEISNLNLNFKTRIVFKIELFENVQLLNYSEFLKKFEINEKYLSYKLKFKKYNIRDPFSMLVSKTLIKNIRVDVDNKIIYLLD